MSASWHDHSTNYGICHNCHHAYWRSFLLARISIKAGRIAFNREQAFQAPEAGIDYYRWHLAHAPSDYQDGTGVAGPYVHAVKDRSGNTVGQFSLDITAPILGSTLVKIKSTGSSSLDPSYIRKIESQVAKPSIAKYSVAEIMHFVLAQGHRNFRTSTRQWRNSFLTV